MSLEQDLLNRSHSSCELCGSKQGLQAYLVSPKTELSPENHVLVCELCFSQLNDVSLADADVNHWRCLNDSMWSEVPAVKVVAWRMLHHLKAEGWTQDLLDMMYMEDDSLAWAKEGLVEEREPTIKHLDSNGVLLQAGDSVVLTQSLNVKGTSFTAKRGTAVRNISLVHDNPEHIEGRVNGQQIVILTKFVKKS